MGRRWETAAAGALAGSLSAAVILAPFVQEWLWKRHLASDATAWVAFWAAVALIGVGTALAVRRLAQLPHAPAWAGPGRLSTIALGAHLVAWVGFLGATTIRERAAISVVATPPMLEAGFLWSRLGAALARPMRTRSAFTAAIISLPATALVTLAAWFLAGFVSGE